MLKYVTEQGGLYYGEDEAAVVAQLRRGEFRPEPRETNEDFMAAVSRRIGNLTGKALKYTCPADFMKALVARGFLRAVDDDIVCPRAHTLCVSRRSECEAGCWLKKAPESNGLA